MSQQPPSAQRTPPRLLLVDDDADILESMAEILSAGYEVSLAYNGVEAIAAVERSAPDLVLLDLNMPVMDGESFLHEMRRRGIALTVIVASAGQDLAQRCRLLGARGYLRKPISIEKLESAVADALRTA
jgi:CheY-like chemotaxis protein